jgi:hypothetical protein
MKKDRGQSLASRLRNSIDKKRQERARARSEAESRQRWLLEECDRLFEDLRAFGDTVGHIAVSGKGRTLRFKFEGRDVRFDAKGASGTVKVSGTAIPSSSEISVHPELDLWVLCMPDGEGKMEQMVLFDQGLERLMESALGLGE